VPVNFEFKKLLIILLDRLSGINNLKAGVEEGKGRRKYATNVAPVSIAKKKVEEQKKQKVEEKPKENGKVEEEKKSEEQPAKV